MLLAIDIGNSNIVFGIYKDGKWAHIWRAITSTQKTSIDYEIILQNYFLESDLRASAIEKTILSSVVPPLTGVLRATVLHFCGKDCTILGADTYPPLKIGIKNPYEIGSDLVANAVAAIHRFPNHHSPHFYNCFQTTGNFGRSYSSRLANCHSFFGSKYCQIT